MVEQHGTAVMPECARSKEEREKKETENYRCVGWAREIRRIVGWRAEKSRLE